MHAAPAAPVAAHPVPTPPPPGPATPCNQRYFGAAVGKGRQGAKNEVEKLKLGEMSCREGIQAVAKMCAAAGAAAGGGAGRLSGGGRCIGALAARPPQRCWAHE